MVVLPSSTFSYNRGAPLDNVPREGQSGVGVCHYFQLRLIPLLFGASIQRPAELALSFPRHVPTMIKDNACLPSPNPPPFPLHWYYRCPPPLHCPTLGPRPPALHSPSIGPRPPMLPHCPNLSLLHCPSLYSHPPTSRTPPLWETSL